MKDLKLFGTAAFPVHPSAMRVLVACPWRMAMLFLSADEGESGPAADTGSAVHKAAHALHTGKGVAEALGVMQAEKHQYPLADLQDAASLFLCYSGDPRNRDAKVVLCEEKIKFTIRAAEGDPTGEAIEVEGTVDQVRLDDYGRYTCDDIKTSKRDPSEVRNESTFQMAAYCIGASLKLGAPVHPGRLIFPRRYDARDLANSKVFYHFNFKFEDIEQILLPVRLKVAQIRRGELYHVPNSDCKWCHKRDPDICLPELQRFKKSLL